jgi:hypothetical protein
VIVHCETHRWCPWLKRAEFLNGAESELGDAGGLGCANGHPLPPFGPCDVMCEKVDCPEEPIGSHVMNIG